MKTDLVAVEPVVASQADTSSKPNPVAQRRIGGMPLMNLGRNQCRYAIAEDRSVPGGHLFCAATTVADRPYCDHHHRLVTNVELRRSGSGSTFRLRAA
jgi:hypothetical protein